MYLRIACQFSNLNPGPLGALCYPAHLSPSIPTTSATRPRGFVDMSRMTPPALKHCATAIRRERFRMASRRERCPMHLLLDGKRDAKALRAVHRSRAGKPYNGIGIISQDRRSSTGAHLQAMTTADPLVSHHSSGFSSPNTVGNSSHTVGWMCTARCTTV